MNCACPAAFGGTSTGRRPALFSSPKRSTARAHGYAGISVPGPAYANPGPGAMGAVHAPQPFGGWHPGWSQQGAPQGPYGNIGPMGDPPTQVVWATGPASAEDISWGPTTGLIKNKPTFNFQAFTDSLLGVFDRVAPLLLGPKGGQGNDQYLPAPVSQKKPVPWLLIGGVAVAVLVATGVGIKVFGGRRRNPRRRR